MCVGIPMQIVSVDGLAAECVASDRQEKVDLALTGPLAPGTWVLVFLGTAREVLEETTARQIAAALRGLEAVMRGGSAGDAFADLDDRTPTLPPHLETARRAGAKTA